MGHSIANGVGVTDTTYGGVAVAGGKTLRDNGSTLANYPSSAGTGPDPGVLPYWIAAVSSTVIRRASNGAVLSQVETQFIPGAISDCIALGISRDNIDCVVLMIGENDADDTTESAAYTARIQQSADHVERAFPNARVVIQNMRSEDAAYPEFATIRTANTTAVAARSTRALAAFAGIGLSDAVHYSLAGYATAGAAQIAAYATAS